MYQFDTIFLMFRHKKSKKSTFFEVLPHILTLKLYILSTLTKIITHFIIRVYRGKIRLLTHNISINAITKYLIEIY